MKHLLAVMILLACAGAALAAPKTKPKITSDPVQEMAAQRNVIVESLSRGESRERACSIVAQQFSLWCAVQGKDFILTRGMGTKITYLATLRIPGK